MEATDLHPDPFVQLGSWFDDVAAADPPLTEPAAMVLATVGSDGQPVARNVMLRGFDRDGFVFFTSYDSRKARHLADNPRACLLFSWLPLHRQVIVTGSTAMAQPDEADAYFAARERDSQLGAWASDQSSVIPDRAWLEDRVREFAERFPTTVPRPPNWGGYRLTPDTVELWVGQPNRLHDRFRYEREGESEWRVVRLSP
jgi:pyridoxamine 5'-phosphate oxidase